MSTICILHGGPADGLELPTADHCCTRRIVIYSVPGKMLMRPAVYLRDVSDQGTQTIRGMDGVEREFPTLGYRFERAVRPELAGRIEGVRAKEIDMEMHDGRSL